MMLEDSLRSGAEIRLQKGSLVTPAARDWLKEHAVPVTWDEPVETQPALAVVMDPSLPEMRAIRTMLDHNGGLLEVIEPTGGLAGVVEATQRLCDMIGRGTVTKGVMFVQDAAVPVCVANKYKGVRAALGISVPMVEEACRSLGINVLVIEYMTQTTYQMKQMVARLVAGAESARPEAASAITAIEQGDERADR